MDTAPIQALGGRALRARQSRGAFGAPGYGYGAFQALVAQAEDERQRILTLSYVPLPSPIGRGRGESRFGGWGEVRSNGAA